MTTELTTTPEPPLGPPLVTSPASAQSRCSWAVKPVLLLPVGLSLEPLPGPRAPGPESAKALEGLGVTSVLGGGPPPSSVAIAS